MQASTTGEVKLFDKNKEIGEDHNKILIIL